MTRLVAVLVLASACYRPGLDAECSIRCTPADVCPDDGTCVNGFCHAPGQTGICGPGSSDADIDGADSDVVTADSAIDSFVAECPQGIEYRLIPTIMTWRAAEAHCEAYTEAGTNKFVHLIVINDDNEFNTFSNTFANEPDASFWIGLTDIDDRGDFAPITSETNTWLPLWGFNQPDGALNQHCARVDIANLNGLDDDECDNATLARFAFICECDNFPPMQLF